MVSVVMGRCVAVWTDRCGTRGTEGEVIMVVTDMYVGVVSDGLVMVAMGDKQLVEGSNR